MIILGIGGSATVDGGLGALQACGAKIFVMREGADAAGRGVVRLDDEALARRDGQDRRRLGREGVDQLIAADSLHALSPARDAEALPLA